MLLVQLKASLVPKFRGATGYYFTWNTAQSPSQNGLIQIFLKGAALQKLPNHPCFLQNGCALFLTLFYHYLPPQRR